jgi:feruloyl esterase
MTAVDVSTVVGSPTIVKAATLEEGSSIRYCRVQAVVDDYAHFEMRLPASAWTQRLLFGGGPAAQVAPGGMSLEHFVTVSWQDLGRRGHEDDFARNYQYRINDGYRGMHLQVLAAKALIAKYYGQGPKYSYFNACSEPGREGMQEVQRFPQDFDGVGAGCPPINFTLNNGVFQAWNVLTNTDADGQLILTADKLPVLHQAILEQCDAADGAKDGIISNPFACHPDVTAVQCKAGQDPAICLTSEQVRVVQELYRGAHDSQGGKLMPIGVLPGSELAWTSTIAPTRNPSEPRDQTTTAIRSQFSDPALPGSWQLRDLKFDRASFDAITKLHYVYDATNPDLAAFAKAGHKLILWQGLGDSNVLPAYAVLYYTALQKVMGERTVDGFVRFYALPGVNHCGGGDGPVISDLLAPLMLWVERGIAPGALPGIHIPRSNGPGSDPTKPVPAQPGAADLTRLLYPYPLSAKYVGSGSVKDAASFVEGSEQPAPASIFDWFGSGFYTKQPEKWCTTSDHSTVLHCK